MQGTKPRRKGDTKLCAKPTLLHLPPEHQKDYISQPPCNSEGSRDCNQWKVGEGEVQHFQAQPVEISPQIFPILIIGLQNPRARISKCSP